MRWLVLVPVLAGCTSLASGDLPSTTTAAPQPVLIEGTTTTTTTVAPTTLPPGVPTEAPGVIDANDGIVTNSEIQVFERMADAVLDEQLATSITADVCAIVKSSPSQDAVEEQFLASIQQKGGGMSAESAMMFVEAATTLGCLNAWEALP